jgi:hypothetical protein
MTNWFDNDDLFRKELEEGHRYAEAVQQLLIETAWTLNLRRSRGVETSTTATVSLASKT